MCCMIVLKLQVLRHLIQDVYCYQLLVADTVHRMQIFKNE